MDRPALQQMRDKAEIRERVERLLKAIKRHELPGTAALIRSMEEYLREQDQKKPN